MQFKDYQNVHALLTETAERIPDQKAFSWIPSPGRTESVTWREFYEQVRKAAKSLVALGVKKGDKVNILSYTSYKWLLTDQAIMSIGATTVGIYQTNLAKDCAYIINHSDSVLVFAEDTRQLDKLLQVRNDIPRIGKIILMNGTYEGDGPVIPYDAFLSLGESVPDHTLTAMIDAVHPDDIATIVYTSGTTGVPKGAMLTHDNATFTVQSVVMSSDLRPGEDTFLFLPLAHIYARLITYTCIYQGISTTFCRSMDTIIEDIKTSRPNFFCIVPRVYEKVYSKVVSGAEARGGLALKIFKWAFDTGYKVSDRIIAGNPIPAGLKIRYAIADRLVFSKLKEALGGRIRFCISGAAPLEPSIARFFHAAGILILEGIGMTENMSYSHVNRISNFRFGSVGTPGAGIEQSIADDGEFLVRGRNVMKGYYKMPAETAEAITPDGWLRTGDLGRISSDGFLMITGRKKDLIITSGGKNIAPSAIEGLMITSKYINQFCVIGDRRNYLTALVTLDAENVQEYAKNKHIPFTRLQDLIANEGIIHLIHNEIQEKNRSLASFESIKKFTIVPEFTIDNDELTPTMKIRRNMIVEHYRDAIAAMYEDMTDSEIAFMKERHIDRRKKPDRRGSMIDPRGEGAIERRVAQRRMSPAM
ncbi:MAG TPA: long-chain fatty acid--CoA ligase [Spirochaetota bacterium]|nr:long-chain fatty acid--CoA ligase [Spirochaetota bacterium]HOD14816.1 long-chain fatty acid--CoA ligase [Spirochaetota bacterium]HPG51090.1 long-chain fatty acid--CoA ligase [Spirochaetota bacterium]HPN11333.1 long-chain fatty acid--CoA ligase [Spirochaetota bacterium]HQL82713.1 long-chain fatty acid--CoA ligase [Spirochaetota bacterium]